MGTFPFTYRESLLHAYLYDCLPPELFKLDYNDFSYNNSEGYYNTTLPYTDSPGVFEVEFRDGKLFRALYISNESAYNISFSGWDNTVVKIPQEAFDAEKTQENS